MSNTVSQIPSYRFRSFGETVCFVPVMLVGFLCYFLQKMGTVEEVTTWMWLSALVVCTIMACIDLNWIGAAILAVILVLAVPAAQFFGILLEPLVKWLFHEDAAVSIGAMLFFSKAILIGFIAIWIASRITYYDISPNQIESVVAGQRDWTENMSKVSVTAKYPNFLKLLFFGMGDIVVLRDGATVQTVDDIPFLAWWRWKHIEKMRQQLATMTVSGNDD
jgi:hypothetical protein